MPAFSRKKGHDRLEKYISSWETNAPDDEEFGEVRLTEIKADRTASEAKMSEITHAEALVKRLKNEHEDMLKATMQKLDYVTDAVVGNRRFGPNSSLYEGFGYIRESDKKKGGRPKRAPEGEK